MSRGMPDLTPEQFKQVVAHYTAHHGTLRLSCVALGFMSLEQLRTIVAEEQAAASPSTHGAAPAAAPVAELERSAAPAPVAGASLAKRPSAYAEQDAPRFSAAFKALGFDTAGLRAPNAAPPRASAEPVLAPAQIGRQAQADRAAAYAAEIVSAFRLRDSDGKASAERAREQLQHAQQYAAKHAPAAVKPSNPPAGFPDKPTAQRATTASAIALFNQANGVKHA